MATPLPLTRPIKLSADHVAWEQLPVYGGGSTISIRTKGHNVVFEVNGEAAEVFVSGEIADALLALIAPRTSYWAGAAQGLVSGQRAVQAARERVQAETARRLRAGEFSDEQGNVDGAAVEAFETLRTSELIAQPQVHLIEQDLPSIKACNATCE